MISLRSHELISTAKAARQLDCTVQHVRLLIRKGDIAGEKLGRDWLADENSVKLFAERRYQRAKSEPLEVHEAQKPLPFDVPESLKLVNVASVPQRSPFRYPGGKTWFIPIAREWLGSIGKKPELLIEPFAGGGGVSLMTAFEKRAGKVLLVELDPDIANVWRVMLSAESKSLNERILGFDCTLEGVRAVLAQPEQSKLGLAFQTFLRNRVSRGGILAPGAGFTKKGEAGKGISSRWYPETLTDRIAAIYGRRKSIEFLEGDGLSIICEYSDDPEAAFFIDPPYPVAGRRLYRFHDLDHRRLFKVMAQLKGSFLATYDHNPDIEALAKEFGFDTRLTLMKSTHHLKKFELLISRDLSWLSEGSEDPSRPFEPNQASA
jgi:DNA adenine methylase